MIFKGIENLTGRELCDIEDMLFPYISKISEDNTDEQKKEMAVQIVTDHGIELLNICYTDDEGNDLTDETIQPYKMLILTEVIPAAITKLFGGDTEQGKPKPRVKAIPKR